MPAYRVIRAFAVTASAIRLELGAHLGQVLTPEMAASIEQAAFFAPRNSPETIELLGKWRHLIEATIQDSFIPVPWESLLATRVDVRCASKSVLISLPEQLVNGKRVIKIWVAAGAMDEVMDLLEALKNQAKENGVHIIEYAGRRGWVRAAGFNEQAVIGRKEI